MVAVRQQVQIYQSFNSSLSAIRSRPVDVKSENLVSRTSEGALTTPGKLASNIFLISTLSVARNICKSGFRFRSALSCLMIAKSRTR